MEDRIFLSNTLKSYKDDNDELASQLSKFQTHIDHILATMRNNDVMIQIIKDKLEEMDSENN